MPTKIETTDELKLIEAVEEGEYHFSHHSS
jgi:hypothetical protein